jgi:uncharacterized protein YbjQ (UPF0145 family)
MAININATQRIIRPQSVFVGGVGMRKSEFAVFFAVSLVLCSLPASADNAAKIAGKQEIAQAQTVDSSGTGGGLIVTTTNSVDGYRIREYRGIVRGVMVREPNTIQQFKAGFQGMFGGKVNAYIKNCEMGRQGAYDAMVQQALSRGANAIVGVKYDSDAFQGGTNDFGTEIVCYGTAVMLEPVKAPQQ